MQPLLKGVFLGASGVLLAVAVYSFHNWWQLGRESHIAQGMVVSVETRSRHINQDTVKILYHPIVSFQGEDGWQVTQSLAEGREVMNFNTNDTLTVVHPKGQPHFARMRHWRDGPLPGIASLVLAALLALGSRAEPRNGKPPVMSGDRPAV